jgi:hypothetical protein
LFGASSKLQRLAVASALVLSLAACGGGDVMSSFDSEKSRVRSGMSGEVACTELPAGPVLKCETPSGDFVLTLEGHPQGGAALSVKWDPTRSAGSETAATEFFRVSALYGLDEADIETCLSRESFSEQGAAHLATCSGSRSRGVMVTVIQRKAI